MVEVQSKVSSQFPWSVLRLSQSVLLCTLITAGLAFSLLSLKYLDFPYLFILTYWLFLLSYLSYATRSSRWKGFFFNLAFLVFALAILEIYSYFHLKEQMTSFKGDDYVQGYMVSDEVLGYGPAKGRSVRVQKLKAHQSIYDVTYTIDESGLRVSSPASSHTYDRCILFFGDSFTFGEGVNDHQTMPYIVGQLSKSQTYNFGFHGYGPHQMLAAIESGMVKRIVDCRPQLAVYQGLVTHVARSAGYSSWDKHGPRYSIQNDGRIAYSGHFDDNKSALRSISNQINVQLSKSYFYNNFFGQNKYRLTEDDIRLFIEIVEESHRKLAEIYPGMTFSVIIWDVGYNNIVDPENVYEKIRNGLTEKGFDIHAISNIIPGIADNRAKYEISSYDKHPNALSHRLIAEYLVRNVVRGE